MSEPTMIEDQAPTNEAQPEKKKRGRPVKTSGQTTSSSGSGRSSAALERELKQIQAALSGNFMMIGIIVSGFNMYDGTVILERHTAVVESLIALARTNTDVRKALLGFITVTVYGQLIAAVSQMFIPIAANHGLLPEQFKMLAGIGGASETSPLEANAN